MNKRYTDFNIYTPFSTKTIHSSFQYMKLPFLSFLFRQQIFSFTISLLHSAFSSPNHLTCFNASKISPPWSTWPMTKTVPPFSTNFSNNLCLQTQPRSSSVRQPVWQALQSIICCIYYPFQQRIVPIKTTNIWEIKIPSNASQNNPQISPFLLTSPQASSFAPISLQSKPEIITKGKTATLHPSLTTTKWSFRMEDNTCSKCNRWQSHSPPPWHSFINLPKIWW